MIEKIIDFSARNKFLIFLITGVGLVFSVWCIKNIPLDAIPDLSDTQVIIYSRWDRSPDIIEDQVTYPIVTALLGAPRVKAVRGTSDFGFSFVYVIFEEGTDLYWARSRVLEYLSKIIPRLPEGVRTEIGPDATGVGWIFKYALIDKSGRHSLADLRTFQDWYLRYWLQSVPGVAEVATTGGFQKQYQVNINPNALVAYNIPLLKVVESIRSGNEEVGGRVLEFSGTEYMVRGRGYIKSVEDIENIVVGNDKNGTPILIKNLGEVTVGPEIRRGIADFNGEGDAVFGIVVMRQGENALKVIERLKTKIEEIKPSLPEGVEIVTVYDRSDLIKRSIATLQRTLKEEMFVVSLVILIFLLHIPSAMIPIFTLPIAVAFSFIPIYFMGLTSNIMSLAGIAIAIGAMVDAAIVVVENAHKKMEKWEKEGRKEDYKEILIQAIKEVGRPSFFSLLVISISFLPIFTLEEMEGRLFKPLAYTKNLSMAMAAVLAITFDPAMRMLFTRLHDFNFSPRWICKLVNAVVVGKIKSEEEHPVSNFLHRIYTPACEFVIEHRKSVLAAALILVLSTLPVYFKLGSEFMPPLKEGDIVYMPVTMPGISVTEAQKLLQVQGKILKTFPEVEQIFGKAGRADTATDNSPLSMADTVIKLKPESQWREKKRWYSWMPEFLKPPFRLFWPDRISWEELINEMDSKMQFPGVVNAWTMPIKDRIEMLTTGIRTPVGIKILGPDLKEIEKIGSHLEAILKEVRGIRSVYAERTAGGYFLDFELKRDQLARYGISIKEAQMVILSAIGGEVITHTVEGRERYSVNLRYARELRDTLPKLKRVLVPTMSGAQIPLEQLAEIRFKEGPSMIKNENGSLAGYVYVDVAGRDLGSFVKDAKKLVRERLKLPPGYTLLWSGQYEYMERVKKKLFLVVPITFFIIFLLLYFSTKDLVKVGIIFLAVPFSAVGAIWLLYLLDYNLSIAVWVGIIALLGIDAETGMFMLLYLDLAYQEAVKKGKMRNFSDLKEAVLQGAVLRVRPKMMTVMTTFIGLLPAMMALGAGGDTMKRIAAPMVGGILTSFIMELLVYPAIFTIWKEKKLFKKSV